jgi:EpsI family protein
MLAQQGSWRSEPLTYWTTVGEQAVLGGINKKLVELRYGLRGEVPDGLLFRVSSIELNPREAYVVHDQFVRDLLAGVSPEVRQRLSGVRGAR